MAGDKDREPSPPVIPATPEIGDGPDIERVTRLAIDQVILDGVVDGLERRAHISLLKRIAFPEEIVSRPVSEEFAEALTEDDRYLDRVRMRYGYTPVVADDTEARISPVAIVKGHGIFSEEEHEALIERLDSSLEMLYRAARARNLGSISAEEAKLSLKAAGIEPTGKEFRALLSYMKRDRRQWLTNEGLIILSTDAEGVAKMPPKSEETMDYSGLIASILSHMKAVNRQGEFKRTTFVGTMRSMGVHLEGRELQSVIEQLGTQANIAPAGEDKFRIVVETRRGTTPTPNPKPEGGPSLDNMMKAAFGGIGQTPRKRRKNRQNR